MPSETVWLALIAMIGLAIKNYLDTRLLITRLEVVAKDARDSKDTSKALEVKVDGRLTELLASVRSQGRAEAGLAEARGHIAGGLATAAQIAAAQGPSAPDDALTVATIANTVATNRNTEETRS